MIPRDSVAFLLERAEATLSANIIQLPSGSYLTAGRNQFKTLWTRDFALAVRGLLLMNRSDVVKHHLTTLIRNRRTSDSLVPRVMDSIAPRWRVMRQFWIRMIPESIGFLRGDLPIHDPLKPEYRDEHGSEAVDSNLLVLKAALEYVEHTGDQAWWRENEEAFRGIYGFYANKLRDGLIWQAKFSDWQDSVKREGHTFYVNLLYYLVSKKIRTYSDWSASETELEKTRQKIETTFRDENTGLFRTVAGYPQISSDGNLLAIDLGYFSSREEEQAHYQRLKNHPLWRGNGDVPGRVTLPAYPDSWKSIAVRVVSLHNYHEDLYWSWLMGLAGKVAISQGDDVEAERVLRALEKIVRRDGAVGEVFRDMPELPLWESQWFRAEIPFSWGAGFVVDFCKRFQHERR